MHQSVQLKICLLSLEQCSSALYKRSYGHEIGWESVVAVLHAVCCFECPCYGLGAVTGYWRSMPLVKSTFLEGYQHLRMFSVSMLVISFGRCTCNACSCGFPFVAWFLFSLESFFFGRPAASTSTLAVRQLGRFDALPLLHMRNKWELQTDLRLTQPLEKSLMVCLAKYSLSAHEMSRVGSVTTYPLPA